MVEGVGCMNKVRCVRSAHVLWIRARISFPHRRAAIYTRRERAEGGGEWMTEQQMETSSRGLGVSYLKARVLGAAGPMKTVSRNGRPASRGGGHMADSDRVCAGGCQAA